MSNILLHCPEIMSIFHWSSDILDVCENFGKYYKHRFKEGSIWKCFTLFCTHETVLSKMKNYVKRRWIYISLLILYLFNSASSCQDYILLMIGRLVNDKLKRIRKEFIMVYPNIFFKGLLKTTKKLSLNIVSLY
jgi:hypothetical protein